MIRKLKVQNYKCLKNVELELRGRNVLIGPNKSGKSTILDLFRFINEAIGKRDLIKIVDSRGGFSALTWKGSSIESTITIELEGIELRSDTSKTDLGTYNYKLVIGADAHGRVSVEHESLSLHEGDTTISLIDMHYGEGYGKKIDGTPILKDPGRLKPALSYEIPGWEASLVREYIARWQFFDLIPQMVKVTSNPAVAQYALYENGSNLPSWLHTFQVNYPDAFQSVIDVAKDAFPEIESISTYLTQAGTTFLLFKERHLQSPISMFDASMGELNFLALLSIIFSPFPIPLVCVEEPENHLHPRLLQLLVEIANQQRIELQGNVSQAFITTHSPYLIDRLDPEDIVVVQKVNGVTVCTRPNLEKDLRRLIKESESTLGELWFSGALGGV